MIVKEKVTGQRGKEQRRQKDIGSTMMTSTATLRNRRPTTRNWSPSTHTTMADYEEPTTNCARHTQNKHKFEIILWL